MKDIDFTECRVINSALCFLTYDEFCKYRNIIKRGFNDLSKDGKLFYKYYVYANIHIKNMFKDKIWNYLNCDEPEVEFELLRALQFYKPIL